MTEADIKKALARRHASDFYITNVKNGPTYVKPKKLVILDAWAMKKSWTKPDFTGYEIKTSRSDFLADKKWERYLPYCEYFFFACPKELIRPDELPENIGLVYVHPETMNCRVVKRARKMNHQPDAAFLMYLMMNKLDGDRLPFYDDRVQALQAWEEDRMSVRNLAFKIRGKIAITMYHLNADLSYFRNENNRLRTIIEQVGIDTRSIPHYTVAKNDREILERFQKPTIELFT